MNIKIPKYMKRVVLFVVTVTVFVEIISGPFKGDLKVLRLEANSRIEEYIKRCTSEIVPKEELDSFDDEELYHIRNGIYAYNGVIFPGNYYESFDWYNGVIELSDFSWDKFNFYEQANINNIVWLEDKRRERNSITFN